MNTNFKHRLASVMLTLTLAVAATGGSAMIPESASAAGSYGVDDYQDRDATDCSAQYGVYSWCKSGTWVSPRRFAYRNCTDFVSFRIGINWGSLKFPNGDGNARGWKQGAVNSGYQVGTQPVVGAVAWWGSEVGGGFGHVAVVVSINSDGSSNIEQYNQTGTGRYSRQSSVRPDAYLYIGVQAPGSTLTTPAPTPPPPPPTWLSSDVNGDGRADLSHLWAGGINTLLSNADGTYTLVKEGWKPRADYGMGIGSTTWLTSDVNGDGRADLSHLWAGGINTLLSNADGTYTLVKEGWKPAPTTAWASDQRRG